MTNVVVCGTRQYYVGEWFDAKLSLLLRNVERPQIISGGARGADRAAEMYANTFLLDPAEVYPADWNKYGKPAGHIRNKQMVDLLDKDAGDFVIAFWNGESKGTYGTISCAKKKGLGVRIVLYKSPIMVDESLYPYRGENYCHMMSTLINGEEAIAQLHEFAAIIGLKRSWFQNHPTHPHYDINPAKRELAVKWGAQQVTSREMALRIMEHIGTRKVRHD